MRSEKILVLKDFAPLAAPLLLMAALLALRGAASHPDAARGIKEMKRKNFEAAKEAFFRHLEKNPLDPYAHLNSALAHDKLNSPLKSLVSYKLISSRFSGFPGFCAHFNSGELSGRLGLVEEALSSYQSALSFKWERQKIKENIELLFNRESQKNKSQKSAGPGQKKSSQPEGGAGGAGGAGKKPKGADGGASGSPNGAQGRLSQSNDGGGAQRPGGENQDSNGQPERPEEQPAGEGSPGGQRADSALSGENEEAILKEIEKQDVKVRAKTFKNRKTFGDKTKYDW